MLYKGVIIEQLGYYKNYRWFCDREICLKKWEDMQILN